MVRNALAKMLVERGMVDSAKVNEALALERQAGRFFGRILVEKGNLKEEQLLDILSSQLGLSVISLNGDEIAPHILAAVPAEIAQKYKCIPVARENGSLTLAISNPTDSPVLAEVSFLANCHITPVLCSEEEILRAIERNYNVTVEKMLAGLTSQQEGEGESEEYFIHDLQERAKEPTLVNLVNLIISQAVENGATDIHVEPFEREMKIKYRIDGILHEMPPPPKNLQASIVSRLKIMAGMDIAKRHIPQDGHIRINLQKFHVDIRIATIPTIFGEGVVMRLFKKDALDLRLVDLGLASDTLRRFEILLTRAYGIILVCGPTGSGKTTTLYAALNKLYTPEKKIITLEDPVEYQLNGINQIPIRPARGLTFASGLRAIVRQDPDILMVGEIRDTETVEIAVRSALTGHLIFSTLHTNDAPSAITRLLDMGVEPYLIASSLQGVLAQRLVRKLCPNCREETRPGSAMLAQFGKTERDIVGVKIYAAAGCEMCHGRGYMGRIGIFELLLMNEELQKQILSHGSSQTIRKVASGLMTTMREDGWQKIRQGMTTIEEVLRHTQRDQVEEENGIAESDAAGNGAH